MSRRRPDAKPRPRLDLDGVVRAAVGLLDDEGLDGLTTRGLAARLGVQSPAIYWHVRDKGELLDLVAEAICAPALAPIMGLADADLGWRQRCEAGLRVYRAVLRSHRDAPRLLADRPPTGPVRRRLADAAVGQVLQAGFPEADAAVISLLLGDYVISIVAEEVRIDAARADPHQPPGDAPVDDPATYPNLAKVGPHLVAVRADTLFETGLAILLDGIERRLDKTQSTRRSHVATA